MGISCDLCVYDDLTREDGVFCALDFSWFGNLLARPLTMTF